MPLKNLSARLAFSLPVVGLLSAGALAQTTILNVSYDVSRELYKDINPAFIADFTQRDVGHVLVTFENEALAIGAELGADKFQIVYPSLSIEAAAPVAVVEKVVDKKGTRKLATAYLKFLFSPQGQEIIGKHAFRPRDEKVLQKFPGRFPAIKTFTVEDQLGGWVEVQAKHFADGGCTVSSACPRGTTTP